MAKIVNSVYTPNIRLNVNTVFTNDEVVGKVISVGDMVENLRYTQDGEIKTVTGVVSDITYKIRTTNSREYVDITKLKTNFANDVTPVLLVTDCSEKYASNVIDVPVREIIEDEGVLDVKKVVTFLEYGVSGQITLSDETVNEFTVWEGDMVTGVEYISRKGDQTMESGRLAVIKYNAKMLPTQFIFNVNSKIVRLNALDIKNIAGVQAPSDDTNTINDLIADADDGDIILLAPGIFSEPLKFDKNVSVMGNYADVPVNPQNRNKSKLSAETVISGRITAEKGKAVDVNGVTLTGQGNLVDSTNYGDISVKNNLVYGIDTGNKRGFVLYTHGDPCKLDIEGNYFGANPDIAALPDPFRVYNLFEIDAPLKDGSKISGNYFEQGSCTHNDINIYQVEDGATIEISDNVWEKSNNGIRIGTKGDAHCTINIKNNVYMSTDEDYPEWAGLVCIQPYAKSTTDMSHVVINIENTKHNDGGQVFYLYAGKDDMQFTEYNVPTVIVDGKVVVAPIPPNEEGSDAIEGSGGSITDNGTEF